MKLFEKNGRDARETTLGILRELFGSNPPRGVRARLWDGTVWPENAAEPAVATIVLQHPGALREMFLGNSEAALGEAYLRNDFDIEGNIEAAFALEEQVREQTGGWSRKLAIGSQLLKLPAHKPEAPEDPHRANLSHTQHSEARDREAIAFHYDVSNDFYGLWLDPERVYSCAYFHDAGEDLETAQRRKLDTICRKLALKPGDRLMDIGCGWGGLIMYAARHYGVRARGITLSEKQAEYAREQIRARGLADRVEVLLQDYREAGKAGQYDAVVSVGMVEHVGRKNLPLYFKAAHRLLKPGGLFLNHGIGTGVTPAEQHGESFIERYVFPDGDLFPITEMNQPAEPAGFEIRDVENLREHYALTLRHWVRRLEARHQEALCYVSEPVYRTWRVYMAGSASRFASGALAIYQTLLAKPLPDGRAPRMALDRAGWYGGEKK